MYLHSKKFLFFIIILLSSSCATHKLSLHKEHKEWKEQAPPTDVAIEHTVFLIGDAGYYNNGQTSPALKGLKQKLDKASENSSVIFLGDNIYPSGMPQEGEEGRSQAEASLKAQLDALEDFKGKPFFLAGNHDWKNGLKGVKAQEKFIETHLNNNKAFVPKAGCGGPDEVEVSDNVVIIFVDSQWWMEDWDNEPKINEGCYSFNKAEFKTHILDVIKGNQEKTVIFAMHHPLYTSGPHGGQFSAKQIIFPFIDFNPNLYIPFPIVPSALRKNLGIRQDLYYPPFQELKREIMSKAQGYNNLIFVGGHEHNLQYIQEEEHHFIVSGAGSKRSPAKVGAGTKFTYGEYGFSQIDFYENGESWLSFYGTKKENPIPELLYRVQIQKPTEVKEFEFPIYEEHPDSIIASIYPTNENKTSGFQKLMWGELHRDQYYKEVKVPVFYLDEHHGGLKPIKKGGGNQTNSLRLENAEGKQYVLRSMEKDATRILGGVLKGTFLIDLMVDVFTFSHPYAAYTLPSMADAAGIYHTNPKLVYLPKQPELGHYNEKFGGGLFLFEERPAGDRSDVYSFGRSTDIVSSPKVFKKMMKNYKHRIDHNFALKSRLFDMTVGDWDRHPDQWRWASFEDEDGEGTYYRPIPRDRDQPFSKFDGIFPNLINKTVPLVRVYNSFEYDVQRPKWYNHYGRIFDRVFLTEPTWEDWQDQVRYIQENLSDDIIESAIKNFPPPVYADGGEEIIAKIKSRRDKMMQIARRHYELLQQSVDIAGTQKADYFQVERLNDNETRIRVYHLKDGEKKEMKFDRVFYTKETKEIILYGLGGKDKFEITGDVKKGILIRAVGGVGHDTFIEASRVSGIKNHTRVYDYETGNTLFLGTEGRDKTTKIRHFNDYDYTHFERNYGITLPAFNYTRDDGFGLGLSWNYWKVGFKKQPFAQTHKITGVYSFGTSGSTISYEGAFNQAIHRWDFVINADWFADRYRLNYFGLGNQTANPFNDNLQYNQVRQGGIRIAPALRRIFISKLDFQISPYYEYFDTQQTADRILDDPTITAILPSYIFDGLNYGGVEIKTFFDSRDIVSSPTHGMKFNGILGWKQNLDNSEKRFGYLNTNLSVYQTLTETKLLVAASQFGFQHIFGDTGDYEFFQSPAIGGRDNLRGFRQERFRGNTAFHVNNDLRLNFGKFKNRIVPMEVGLFGSFDVGRVWLKDEDSKKWHNSYGGGVWINILSLTTISGGLHHSKDGNQFIVNMGFNF